MNKDLKIIKKKYGENMMHLCRMLFPSILETEGLLSKLILDSFDVSRYLYDDLVKYGKVDDFKSYIYSKLNKKEEVIDYDIESPKEIFDKLGYDFYECLSEEEIQSFKKYYYPGEELCTFRGGRLSRCYVFWVVKRNALSLNRESYKRPNRQDEYGTSVMSIQFTKDLSHILSIKNRYNHTVDNPDATYSNDLDNIYPGLTDSFLNTYGLKPVTDGSKMEIPGYVMANDGKFYKYNYEKNNIYYCTNNVIIDYFEVKKYPKEQYIIMDYFILDLKNRKIYKYAENIFDTFCESIGEIERIEVKNDDKNKIVNIYNKDGDEIIIGLDENNRIISYENRSLEKIDDFFLNYNTYLKSLITPNVVEVGNNVLSSNIWLKEVDFPLATKIGNLFLSNNREITRVNLPNVTIAGGYFLRNASNIKKISMNSLEKCSISFMERAYSLESINFPLLQETGVSFIDCMNNIKEISLPSIKKIDLNFMRSNRNVRKVYLPNVEIIGDNFMSENLDASDVFIPSAKIIGNNFMTRNNIIKKIKLNPECLIGHSFLRCNKNVIIEGNDDVMRL